MDKAWNNNDAVALTALCDCRQLGDLAPLASLTSLKWLEFSECVRVSDLRPLAALLRSVCFAFVAAPAFVA